MPEQEPSFQELVRIEMEWPLIEAEMTLLDAEIAALAVRSQFAELARRRVRRAEMQVLAEARDFAIRCASARSGVAA